MTGDYWESVAVAGQIIAYILAGILIVQIIRAILGGTWRIEEIILALLVFNLTITFGMLGYLSSVNSKISSINSKVERHLGWHKGVSNGLSKAR